MATKRAVSSDASDNNKRLRADTIRLNVGGRLFETASETLVKAEYFQPVLTRRIGHAVDDSGAFLIDRDGDLFGIILQWLRTYDRPSQRTLEKYGDALLEECGNLRLVYQPESDELNCENNDALTFIALAPPHRPKKS